VRGGRQGQQKVAEAVAVQSASRLLTRRTLERLREIATGEPTPAADHREKKAPATVKSRPKKAGAKPAKKAAASHPQPTVKKKTAKK
jgi:hypothetical protein